MPHKDPEARRAYRRAWYEKNRERVLARRRELWADPNNQRRKGNAAYVEANREQLRESRHEWYLANRERHNALSREYRKRNRAQLLEQYRLYREANREKLREEYRAWRERHSERKRENEQRRRALKQGNGGGILERDWLRLVRCYDGRCAYCGDDATEQDHVIPLTRGGRHTIGNVLPACGFCNRSKKDRLLIEWSGRPVT